MVDVRIKKVAKILVDYSTGVKKGDRVQIISSVHSAPLALEIYKLCLQRDAYPWINVSLPGEAYIFYKYAKDHQLKRFPKIAYYEIKNTDVWIAVSGPSNTRELTNIPSEKISLRRKITRPITRYRVKHTRWVIFDYPTNALAQEAGMSLEEFENFVYGACIQDWKKLSKKWKRIADRVNKTDKVEIFGKETELRFSVKGRKAIVDDGHNNMPGGEVFTSVVENSTEGEILFEIPSAVSGKFVENVKLVFKKGKVVKAEAEKGEEFLLKMLDTDKGARRIGEFGIGLNYKITQSVNNILFDEKIGGTIHLALGDSYEETLGKNKSAIHWDLIKDLRKNGEIYFDGELVFKKGKWLI